MGDRLIHYVEQQNTYISYKRGVEPPTEGIDFSDNISDVFRGVHGSNLGQGIYLSDFEFSCFIPVCPDEGWDSGLTGGRSRSRSPNRPIERC